MHADTYSSFLNFFIRFEQDYETDIKKFTIVWFSIIIKKIKTNPTINIIACDVSNLPL